jgi:hypothetical protein
MEFYALKDGERKYTGVIEFYDYNVPIDVRMFSLEDEVPADAERFDFRTQDVGLAQGNLTDKEIAVKVVREFFEALIAKDYVKAGQLWGGFSAATVEQGWGKSNFVRIISIGEPVSDPNHSKIHPNRCIIPCTIETLTDGKLCSKEVNARVTQVLGRRDRWMVEGSFNKKP